MTYFSISLLCTVALFTALLNDRFRIWATLITSGAAYILALCLTSLTEGLFNSEGISFFLGTLVIFVASVFLYQNNILHKIFLLLLSISNFSFCGFFTTLAMGYMPFSSAGVFAAVFSVTFTLLINALFGLCLYRPFRLYEGRNSSLFMLGMCFFQLLIYLISVGSFDFLFKTYAYASRAVYCIALYALMIFCFRSILHAGQYQRTLSQIDAQNNILQMESGDFADMLAATREIKNVQRNSEYALDTVRVMLKDDAEKVPEYIEAFMKSASSPLLRQYHDNPYINAVLATKASLASQTDTVFESSVITGDTPVKTGEICIIINEMLTLACIETSKLPSGRRIHFTIVPTEESLIFETIYTSPMPEAEKFTVKGKKFSEILEWLFEDHSEQAQAERTLENTVQIVNIYGGKMSMSATDKEIILHASIKY